MPTNLFKTYISEVEAALKRGDSTEHTHRPALKKLIESLAKDIVATNEPKRVKCGAPDYIITKGHVPLGYIESKDIGKVLADEEKSEQMGRYLDGLGNLILTDYLEFRWYVLGEHRMTACLASKRSEGKLHVDKAGMEQVGELLDFFLEENVHTIGTPKELAVRMAKLARIIRDSISKAFEAENLTDNQPDPLHEQLEGFRKVLIHDLTPELFADMYAQSICYGLFAARCNKKPGKRFTREHAAYDLPKTNPFLRKMFNYIAGPDLDERIAWAVDDLAEVLDHADIEAILTDFGKRTRQEDPVVHFYETFLAAYDSKMRKSRGVYYTPEPVVSYIVRSIDHILRTDFALADGLADSSKVKVKTPDGKSNIEVHKVQILDPATGTGTFLHGVIDQIYDSFKANKGMWSGYVQEHLLPRLFGFELLMAPYAVAHMKLGLQLAETGYDFGSDERLGIYLTNTLEEAFVASDRLPLSNWLFEEANAAGGVKRDAPVMVVLGNPPYSGHSTNVGDWIKYLLKGKIIRKEGSEIKTVGVTSNYFEVDGKPLKERNPKWLNDDYVKFIRFAQWRIEQTGYGVLAFISNHGYLDNPTFRGMRQSLMDTFDDIYVLDLHGNSKKKERAPDGGPDENVFDIQQGVAIGIFVKRSAGGEKPATVRHAELCGLRDGKYHYLWENGVSNTAWSALDPKTPHYLFVPREETLLKEYESGWKLTEAMPINSVNLRTHRDAFVIDFDRKLLESRILNIRDKQIGDDKLREEFGLHDTRDWSLHRARTKLLENDDWHSKIRLCHYRPFDYRWIFYDDSLVEYPCYPVVGQLCHNNIGLTTTRQTTTIGFEHVLATKFVTELKCISHDRGGYLFPLYLYPESRTKQTDALAELQKRPNLASKFIADFSKRVGLKFIPDGKGDCKKTFGPEDVFSYMYAVFHSPTYRSRYAEFLKTDFPRLPLTSNPDMFRKLCAIGAELTALHLMEKQGTKLTSYPIAGNNTVENVRYTEPKGEENGRVWINGTQYFDGAPPEVWNFHVGGYQVCQKWLKDRKGLTLTYDDRIHYQRIVSSLYDTIRLMAEIDHVILAHGDWPLK